MTMGVFLFDRSVERQQIFVRTIRCVQKTEEVDQFALFGGTHAKEHIACLLRLTAVEPDRLIQRWRATVMQIGRRVGDTPQACGCKFTVRDARELKGFRQQITHVVSFEIGEQRNGDPPAFDRFEPGPFQRHT